MLCLYYCIHQTVNHNFDNFDKSRIEHASWECQHVQLLFFAYQVKTQSELEYDPLIWKRSTMVDYLMSVIKSHHCVHSLSKRKESMDWLKGKSVGNHRFSMIFPWSMGVSSNFSIKPTTWKKTRRIYLFARSC